MTRSIHDNNVLGYTVDIDAKCIVLRTEYRDCGPPFERTDVRFEGVLGYHFFDSLGGILLGIEPVDVAQVVLENAELFRSQEKHAWPMQGCSGDPVEYARRAGATAYLIRSSIGFGGFVICKSMRIEAA
jgi:hypothetical protein